MLISIHLCNYLQNRTHVGCGGTVLCALKRERERRERADHSVARRHNMQHSRVRHRRHAAVKHSIAPQSAIETKPRLQRNFNSGGPSWNITFAHIPPSAAPNCSRTFAPSLISRDLLLPSLRLSPPLTRLPPPRRLPHRLLPSAHLASPLSVHLFMHQSVGPSSPLSPPATRCQSPLGKSPV